MDFTRREFLAGVAAAAGGSFSRHAFAQADAGGSGAADASAQLRPRSVVFMSDLHVGKLWAEQKFKTDRSYDYINETVRRLVRDILSLKELPSHAFILGDISLCYGEERDYEIARELLSPLEQAGVKIVATAGNHDRRGPMARILGDWTGGGCVPGRFASITHLTDCDVILLDSLKEPDPDAEDNSAGRGGCELGEAQAAWLEGVLASAKRPLLVCAHHTAWALGINKAMVKSPRVCGFLHGHNHSWQENILYSSYARKTMIRMLGIPSMGMDRDIGFAVVRQFPDRLELAQVERDYYFPVKTPPEERLPLWNCLVKERHGRRVSFPFEKLA